MQNNGKFKFISNNKCISRMIEEEMSEEDKKRSRKRIDRIITKKSQNLIGYTRNMELTIEAMKTKKNEFQSKERH